MTERSRNENLIQAENITNLHYDSKVPVWQSPYPTGLGGAVAQTLQSRDAVAAMELSDYLLHCELGAINLENARRNVVTNDGTVPRSVALAALSREELFQRDCQTVQGDPAALRLDLLKIAVEASVSGAAAKYLVAAARSAESLPDSIYQAVRFDAFNGDLWSLGMLASDYGSRLKVSNEERAIAMNALARLHTEEPFRTVAESGLYNGLLLASANNGLPAGVRYSRDAPRPDLTPEYLNATLVDIWAVKDPKSAQLVDQLVAAAKRTYRANK